MTIPRRQFLHLAAGAVAFPAFTRVARAQAYPTRPITMIVPIAPGGLFDVLARVLAEHMRKVLGQTVVIENIGGASGSIAIGRAARAAPDGYTIAIGSEDQFVVNAAIYPLQYDVVKDFEPVALMTRGYSLVVGKKSLPANNLKELIGWLKANHATVAIAHNGAGGQLHRCGLAVQRAAGVNSPFVPYRGAAPALQDIVGGRIDLMCASSVSALPLVTKRPDTRLRIHRRVAARRRAGRPDGERSGLRGPAAFRLGCGVRTKRYAERRDRKAARRVGGCGSQCGRAEEVDGNRTGDLPARAAIARSAGRAAKG